MKTIEKSFRNGKFRRKSGKIEHSMCASLPYQDQTFKNKNRGDTQSNI